MNLLNYNSNKFFIILVISVLSFSSCKKEIPTVNQTGSALSGNFSQVFDDFWNDMNNNYVFWSIDTTNWDNMNKIYKPLFAKLNLYDSTDETTAKGYFKSMVDGLTDSHYTLFPDGDIIQPAHDRKLKNPVFIENLFGTAPYSPSADGKFYYTNLIDTLYLDSLSAKIAIDSTNSSGSGSDFMVVSGTINNGAILYLSFSSFNLVSEYQGGIPKVKTVLDYFFSQLKNTSIKGLIIDVRGNGGGDLSDLNFLVGSLISSPIHFGYTRSKNGNGRLDYTPWADAIVTPTAGAVAFTKPIVVLADGESVSLSELTAMSLKTLPNTTIVGDTTWGANGPLTDNEVFNAGSFNFGKVSTDIGTGIANYYGNAYTSSTMFKYIDNKIYEGKGFPPDYDIKVKLSDIFLPNNFVNDPQLNKAISIITP